MKTKKLKKIVFSILSVIVILCAAFYIYTLDYNRANAEVFNMDGTNDAVTEKNMTVFLPLDDTELVENTGIIFYPGGKVEASAYAPLLLKLADYGIPCILLEMPMNLAIFDINAADAIYEQFPDIDNWYLVGHSLGGAMSSQYAGENYDKLKGLILLGAYPLNDADVDTIVIYGSEDIGLNMEKLEGLDNLYELEGGNHSFFGNYGENQGDQKRDGDTTLTREEQQNQTVDIIIGFIGTEQLGVPAKN